MNFDSNAQQLTTRRDVLGALKHPALLFVTGEGAGRGFRLLSLLIVARSLGPSDFGIFMYAFAFGAVSAPLLRMGLHVVTMREIALHPNQRDVVATANIARLATLPIMAGLLTVLVVVGPDDDAIAVALVAFAAQAFFWSGGSIMAATARADGHPQVDILARPAEGIALALVTALIALTGHGSVIAFAVSYAVVDAIYFLTTVVIGSWLNLPSVISVKLAEVRRFALLAVGPFAGTLVFALMFRLDGFMLPVLASPKEAGIYAAVFAAVAPLSFVPRAYIDYAYPGIVKGESLSRVTVTATLLSLLLSAVTFVSYMLLLPVLFGKTYEFPVLLLAMLAATLPLMAMFDSLAYALHARRSSRYAVYAIAVGAAANGATNAILIPRFGAEGAALASITAWVLSTLVLIVFFARSALLRQEPLRGDVVVSFKQRT